MKLVHISAGCIIFHKPQSGNVTRKSEKNLHREYN